MSDSSLCVACRAALALCPESDLASIAQRLRVSKRTLQTTLRRAGLPFQMLRNEVRLERAEALLVDDPRPVRAIATAIGFTSVGHFIHWFRRYRGATPGLWRARMLRGAR